MAKTRPNRKQIRRLKQKQSFSVATQVRLLAEQLANQQQLDTVLLAEPDPTKRARLFDFMKPFLKFPDPQMPSTLVRPSLIIKP